MPIEKPFLLKNNLRRLVKQIEHEAKYIELFHDYFKDYFRSNKNIKYICKHFANDPLLTEGESRLLKKELGSILEDRARLFNLIEEISVSRTSGLDAANKLHSILKSKLE